MSTVDVNARVGAAKLRRRPTVRAIALPGALRCAPLAAGLLAWAFAASRLQVADADLYGLLRIVDAWFFVGLALIVGGFLVELLRSRPSAWVLGFYLVGLVVAIHATVPIASGTPEYAWVYKHIGVAEALRANGQVTDATDIYQQWPGLFAGLAGISALSGVGPLAFAAWAPLAFQLANCLLLVAVFRSLTRNLRVSFLAVALYECVVSWVGQDYLAPQAFGYLLWLGVMLIALRWLRATGPAAAGASRLSRVRTWVHRDLPPGTSVPVRRGAAVAITLVLFATIVISHQLTPYAALVSMAALALLDLLRPRWLVLAFAAMAVGFLATRYHLISSQYGGLLSGTDPVGNASGTANGWHSSAQAFTATVVRVLALSMWLLTLAIVARRLRAPGRVVIPAVLAFAPFAILLGQSYGGEAIYRVFLFSAPWCAYLIAEALLGLRWTLVRRAAVAAAVVAALLAGLQGLYGPVAVNAFTPAEVSASTWLYAHAPHGSTFVLAAEDFPALQSADYAEHTVLPLPSDPLMGEVWLDASDEPTLERWVAGLGSHPAYLVLSDTMIDYARYYGFPRGLSALQANLSASPRWAVAYRNADVVIYRFASGGGG
jgi:hypothetical protein